MNHENIDKLIRHFESLKPENFDMCSFFNFDPYRINFRATLQKMKKGECDTTACIAGHAVLLKKAETTGSDCTYNTVTTADEAAKWLGLTILQKHELFYEMDHEIKPSDVIPVLRNLKKTGRVDWSKVRERDTS